MNNYQLREYQTDLIDRVNQSWKSGTRSIMMQLPTGGGKTIVFSHLIAQLGQSLKTLVLAHREELILQAVDKITAIAGIAPGIIKAGYKSDYTRSIQVASVQSLTRRLSRCPQFDLVIVDEAHHSTAKTYQKILNQFPQSRILGVTATPIRLDGKGFRGLFDDLVCGVKISQLIEIGSLSPYKYYAPDRTMSLEGVGKRGGDYRVEQIAEVNDGESVAADCIKAYQDYLEGKQVVVFAISVEQSMTIAASFEAWGIPSIHLDGTSDHQTRSQAMELFRNGHIKVLTNCALFDEGLDIPSLDGVILARPTASLGRYLQMVGRALRPSPNKDHARIIDLAGNWERFGLPDDDRIWSLDGVETKARSRLKRLERDKKGRIREITIDLTESSIKFTELTRIESPPVDGDWLNILNELIDTQRERNYQKGWLVYRLQELETPPPIEVWELVGQVLKYKTGWAKYQIARS